jgi:hypothetical protein
VIAVDLANYTAVPTPANLACLRARGVTGAIIGTRGNGIKFGLQAQAFLGAGFTVEAYVFLYAHEPGIAQANAAMVLCRPFAAIRRIWMDVESDPRHPDPPPSVWRLCLRDARSALLLGGFSPGIYTSISKWTLTGNTAEHADLPLWEARWRYPSGDPRNLTEPPLPFVPFGGWTERAMVQYAGDVNVCTLNLDFNERESAEEDEIMPYTRPVAAFFVGKLFQPGRLTIKYGVDFPQARGARALDVDLTLTPGVTGQVVLYHGSGAEAGRVSPQAPQRVIRVFPREGGDREADAEIVGGAGLMLALAGMLG